MLLVLVFAGSAVMQQWVLALPIGVALLALWAFSQSPLARAFPTDPTPRQVRHLRQALALRSDRVYWQAGGYTFLLRTVTAEEGAKHTRVIARFHRDDDVYDVFFLVSGSRYVYHEIHPLGCLGRGGVPLHRRLDTAREAELRDFLKKTSGCYATEEEVTALVGQICRARRVSA